MSLSFSRGGIGGLDQGFLLIDEALQLFADH